MAFGPEVGSVSVRVMPDTRGFRAEANRQLKAIKDQLKELKVKLVVDAKGFEKATKKYEKKPIKAPVKADFDQFQKKALADLKKVTAKLDAKIPLTTDGEQARKELTDKVKELEKRIKAEIPVDAELAADARREIRSELRQLVRQLDVQPAEVRVSANTNRARAQLRELIDNIPKYAAEGRSAIRVDIDEGHSKAALRELIAELKAEAALADIEIDVDIDTNPLKRAAVAASGAGSKIAKLGIQPIALAAAVMMLFAPALALVSGLLVTLPGLLSALLTPIAAVALGMDGLKKAAERLKEPFEQLKKTMSNAFEKAFTPLADQVKNSGFFGVLEQRLPLIANGLASMAKGLVDSVTSVPGMNKISDTIGNISDALFRAGPGVRSFSDGLIGLAEGFSKKFPGLAETFNKWGDSFNAWVDKITKNGSLDRAMDNLGKIGGQLGGLIKDLAKTGFERLSDPEFGKKMETFVANVRTLVNDLMPALKQLFIDIADAVDQTVTAIDKIASVGKTIKDILNFGSKPPTEKPDTNNFWEPFTSQDAPWRDYWAQIKEITMNAVTEIKIILQGLWNFIQTSAATAFTSLATFFLTVPATISNAFLVVRSVIGGLFSGLGSTIVQQFTALPGAIASVMGQIVGTVSGFLSQLPGMASGLIGQMVSTIAGGLSQLVGIAAGAMAQFIGAIASGVSTAVAKVQEFGSQAVAAVTSFVGAMTQAGVDLIMGLVGGLGRAIGSAVAKAREVASSIVSAVKGIFNSNSPSKVFMGIGNDVVDGLTIGIGEKQNAATSQAASMAQGVVDSARTVIADGIDPLMVDIQLDPEALKQLKAEKDLLDLQAKTIGVQKDQAPDKMAKAALQAQLDQINARKREIALIQEQAEYQKKYGQEVASTQADYSSQMQSMAKIPYDFAKTTANSFMSDLGISGNGALPALANWGLDMGSKFIFNVGGTDQAISMQQNIQRKEAAVRY